MAIIKLNNQSISAVSALPAGVGGKVLQVQANDNSSLSQVSSNTNSLVDVSGMDVTLTPSSTSSKIIIWVSANMGSGNNTHQFAISLSSIIGGTQTTIDSQYETLATKNDTSWITNIYKHSPSTTSEITYRLQFRSFSSNIVYFNRRSLRIVAEEYSS